MKLAEKLIKLGLAIAAVAGIAYLIVTYIDTIKAWLAKVCPCCTPDEEVEVEVVTENVEEPVAEEAPVVEEAPAEVPAAEEVTVPEGTPVAEEADFEA